MENPQSSLSAHKTLYRMSNCSSSYTSCGYIHRKCLVLMCLRPVLTRPVDLRAAVCGVQTITLPSLKIKQPATDVLFLLLIGDECSRGETIIRSLIDAVDHQHIHRFHFVENVILDPCCTLKRCYLDVTKPTRNYSSLGGT